MHAYDERGTGGDGQKAIKVLDEKYLTVTEETIHALQAALAATTMGTGRRLGSLHCEGKTPAQQADRVERTRHRAALQGHHSPRTSGEIPIHQPDDLRTPSSTCRRSRPLCDISTWTTCLATRARASLSRDVAWPCQWSQSLTPPASVAITAVKRGITRAAAPCPARPTISGTTVTRGRAGRLEERQRTPRRNGTRFTRPLHTTTPTVSMRERRTRRRAGCFLLLLSALNLFIPRATRSRPSTSTKISTAASSSKKRTNRHSKGSY